MHSSYALPVLNMLPQYASFDSFSVMLLPCAPMYLFIAVAFIQAKYNTNIQHSYYNLYSLSVCLYHTKNHDIPARKAKPTSFNLLKRFSVSLFQSLGFSLHKSYVLYCLRILLTHRPKELPLVGTLQLWWIARYATSFTNCFSQAEWLFIPMKESKSYRFDLTFLLVDLVE